MSGQQHAPAALYPRERPGTHFTGGWVGPRAGLDGQCSQQTATKCGPQHHNLFPVFQEVSSFDVFQLKFCTTTCPAQLTFLVFKTVLSHYTSPGKQYALWTWTLSVFMFLHPPRSFLARPRLSSHIPFHLQSSFTVKHQISHPHKTTDFKHCFNYPTPLAAQPLQKPTSANTNTAQAINTHVKIPLTFTQDIFLPG